MTALSLTTSAQQNFSEIEATLARFSLPDFTNPARVAEYVQAFGLEAACAEVEQDRLKTAHSDLLRSVSANEEKPFGPNFDDLSRLHWLALSRKAVNVMEFGSGYSTVVLAHAARLLHGYFGEWAAANIRVEKPFHIYSIEEEQRFADITVKRLGEAYAPFATVSRSSVEMALVFERYATLYSILPNISPDLIYLDGPSQYATTEVRNGFSIATRARMPMSADILRFEFFLEPGTLIITDGRTANARFLKAHFKRNWAYRHDTQGDVHLFELQEEPLGKFNRRKLEFCLKNRWLLA